MTDSIPLEGVSVERLRLLRDEVVVRAAPAEEVRGSGLYVPNKAKEHTLGAVFYGTAVKVGPGRVVERGPTAEQFGAFVFDMVSKMVAGLGEFSGDDTAAWYAREAEAFVRAHTTEERVSMKVQPGDAVVCRQGFGAEISLREGLHHIVERADDRFGHGVLMAWEREHTHCWHADETCDRPDGRIMARCACAAVSVIETRLPACASCPPGERLAEAVLAHRVYDAKAGPGDGPGFYEEKPVDDGGLEV